MAIDARTEPEGFEHEVPVTQVTYIDHPDQRRITVAELQAAAQNRAGALCLARGAWHKDGEPENTLHRTGRCINPESHVRAGAPHSWENENGTFR